MLNQVHINGYMKVSRPIARRLFYNRGHDVYIIPCKMRFDNIYLSPLKINNESGYRFEHLVNDYEYYNCNAETGYYCSFYVLEKDYDVEVERCLDERKSKKILY